MSFKELCLAALLWAQLVLFALVACSGEAGDRAPACKAENCAEEEGYRDSFTCPDDPTKDSPGVCGCGVPDKDDDGDGYLNCLDACPHDPLKYEEGVCGCGLLEEDADLDGVVDCLDECPLDPRKYERGVCGCGMDELGSDRDGDADGILDCLDGCPSDSDKTEPGICGCGRQEDTCGLVGTYFRNARFGGLATERLDHVVDFDWGEGSPYSSTDYEPFSVRWKGFLEASSSEEYAFETVSDDGVRLWVGGELLIDDWFAQGKRKNVNTIVLDEGQRYPVVLEFFESWGNAMVQLWWSSTSMARQIVPASQLFSSSDESI